MMLNVKTYLVQITTQRRNEMSFLEIFELSDKAYNKLKYVVQIILPAIATFIGILGLSLGLPYTELIVTIFTAVIALLGSVLGISSYNYNK